MGYPGPQALPKPAEQADKPLAAAGRGGGDARGRRRRRRLRRRRRRDRGRARQGRPQACASSRWAATTTSPTSSASSSPPTSSSTSTAGRSRPPRGRSACRPAPRSAAARCSTGPTACAPTDWVRDEWANEFGLEGLDGSDYDAHLDAVWERLSVNDRLLGPERPAPAAQGGLSRRAGGRLRADHPQHRPRDLRPGDRRLHGLRRAVGLEALDAEDLPRRRRGERRRVPRQLPDRADPDRGRARASASRAS